MAETLERRLPEKAAIIAHRGNERILVVRIAGYERWMLPYGDYSNDELPIETARRVLGSVVCCRKVSYAQDLGETVAVEFSPVDRETWDVHATANFFRGRSLRLYLAELDCDSSEMMKGPRVEAINMVRYDRLGGFLQGAELGAVADIVTDLRAGRIR
ncbi:hypothetical protein JW898_04155 [Candidatus Woesearchaeota archaeon]|nr:hypothetical protein [Candidatus Woesearchaeota archaeon]